jgi:hypothetical protein
LLVVKQETPAHGDKTDPNFQYGVTQAYVALVILVSLNEFCFGSFLLLLKTKNKESINFFSVEDSLLKAVTFILEHFPFADYVLCRHERRADSQHSYRSATSKYRSGLETCRRLTQQSR